MSVIYNSLSQKKERLIKPRGHPLRLFVCGPTVYDDAHVGHARTYIVFDAYVRYLRAQKWNVFYLQNITDVDDKIINRARETKSVPFVIAKKFEKSYRETMKKLNVASVSRYARASDFIPEIVSQVKTLIKKGYAYEIKGDGWYFDIAKFKEYGKLSKRTHLQAEDAVSRIDDAVKKRNKGDFCLWKYIKVNKKLEIACLSGRQGRHGKLEITKGEPAWSTPLGWGRPGWHIEDTAISESFFGSHYDLHGGANELKFPHHEAEIAQQEAASGKKPFVKVWMHTGVLTIHGKKMSKSLKNFVTVNDFLNRYKNTIYGANILRMLILMHHYRTPVDYNDKALKTAQGAWDRIEIFLKKLELAANFGKRTSVKNKSETTVIEHAVWKALEDDFNTPKALAAIFSGIGTYAAIYTLSRSRAKTLRISISTLLKMLGFSFTQPALPQEVKKLIRERELSRKNKQFMQADALRVRIKALGYEVEDTPLGPLAQKNF